MPNATTTHDNNQLVYTWVTAAMYYCQIVGKQVMIQSGGLLL
jgi:hypothetical protein